MFNTKLITIILILIMSVSLYAKEEYIVLLDGTKILKMEWKIHLDGGYEKGYFVKIIPGKKVTLFIDGVIKHYKWEDIIKINGENKQLYLSKKPKKFVGKKEKLSPKYTTVFIMQEKNPGIAFLCSFFITGGGQLYNGEGAKALCILGASFVGTLLVLTSDFNTTDSLPQIYGGCALIIFPYFYSLIDAPLSAVAINKRNRKKLGLVLSLSKRNTKIGLSLNF